MAHSTRTLTGSRRQLLILGIVLVLLYVVVPQLGNFRSSLAIMKHASPGYATLAVMASLLTYFAAAATYVLLAFKPLRYTQTVLIQLGSMFANRLLPAGIGGIGVNYRYLRRNRHTASQAASVVTANNLAGLVGHLCLLSIVVGISHKGLVAVRRPRVDLGWLPAAAVILCTLLAILYIYFRQPVGRAVGRFVHQLLSYRHRPVRVGGSLISSISLTLCNVLSLWFCLLALHISLPFLAILLVFTLGIAVGTALPTPGGLGGIEAGMIAGLITQGVSGSAALAAVLSYRLINYWLALLMGAVAFSICEKYGYV